ncbi:MAG: hypothetical protein M1449_01775 [Candidatus Thermoplasmatota archaeon]|nr:hypothetical protein [Candidatus Thermoplasmatota archaeon]
MVDLLDLLSFNCNGDSIVRCRTATALRLPASFHHSSGGADSAMRGMRWLQLP